MGNKSLFGKIKEAGMHTIVYGLGSVLQSLLGFLLIPFYTRYYTPEMFGIFSLITLCSTLAGVIFYLGISSSLARSYYDYSTIEERKKVVSTSFYMSVVGAVLQCLLAYLLKNHLSLLLFKNKMYGVLIWYALIASAITILNNLFYVVLRFERKSLFVVIINLISVVLTTGLTLFFLIHLKWGIKAPILGMLINQAVIFLLLLSVLRKFIVFKIITKEIRIQLAYGFPAVIIGLGYYLLDWIGRLFINKYCSLSDVGVFSLGYKLGMLIQILLVLPFSQIWMPMRMEYRHDENANELFTLISTYYFLIGFFFTVIISMFSKEVLILIGGNKEYFNAYKVIPYVMMGHLMYGAINIIDNGIIFQRKVMYHAYIFWITIVINVILNYLLIPRFGYIGSAYSTLLSYTSLFFMVYSVSNRLYKIHFEIKRLAKILVFGLLVLTAGRIVSVTQNIYSIAIKIFLVILLTFLLYFFVLSEKEKRKITNFIKDRVKLCPQ